MCDDVLRIARLRQQEPIQRIVAMQSGLDSSHDEQICSLLSAKLEFVRRER